MKAFLNHLGIQFKMDLREKGVLLVFYVTPLIFYAVMGAVFSSINPETRQTLSASMSIFAMTMGAVLGIPVPLVKMREAGVLRAYDVNGIPGWAVLLSSAVSALIHLLIVSALIFLTAPVFFQASMPVDFAAYFLTLAALLFGSISVGLLLGVMAKNQASATMLSQVVFMPSLLLSGIMFPANMLPAPLMWLGRALPATHAMQSFSSWAFGQPADIAPAVSLAVMAGIGAVALALAIRRFNALRKTI
jgi:ABC-2 type transport system permease protein